VCGQFNALDQRRNLTQRLKTAYKHNFGCQVGDQDKSWAPHVCCTVCYSGLTQWLNGKRKKMPFAIPIMWREPTNHYSGCYFAWQPLKVMENRYQRKLFPRMIGDYCWFLQWETDVSYMRKSKCLKHLWIHCFCEHRSGHQKDISVEQHVLCLCNNVFVLTVIALIRDSLDIK